MFRQNSNVDRSNRKPSGRDCGTKSRGQLSDAVLLCRIVDEQDESTAVDAATRGILEVDVHPKGAKLSGYDGTRTLGKGVIRHQRAHLVTCHAGSQRLCAGASNDEVFGHEFVGRKGETLRYRIA